MHNDLVRVGVLMGLVTSNLSRSLTFDPASGIGSHAFSVGGLIVVSSASSSS
jgi:hypothetical protein